MKAEEGKRTVMVLKSKVMAGRILYLSHQIKQLTRGQDVIGTTVARTNWAS